jgi:hypothetical protein
MICQSLCLPIPIISLDFQPTMKVNVHNQCSNFYLKGEKHFSTGIDWDEEPDEEVYAGDTMNVDLVPLLSTFEGLLTYGLKKRGIESTYIQLFVTWKSEGYKELRVFVHLIEYDGWCGWGKDKLEEYCQRYASQLCTYTGPIRDTWLMPDGTVLMTELELDFTQRDGVLNITISEGVKDEHTKKLEWFNSNR